VPFRTVVSRELAELLSVLSHPHRLRIVEELGTGELDVGQLQALLGISHSGVSQHLSVMRAHRLVMERREGRHVFYRLRDPELAAWLLDGLTFLESDASSSQQLRRDVRRARAKWASD
jgi:DNA-binding transcriptional ArsR family regulator